METLVLNFSHDELAILSEVCRRVQTDGFQRAEDLKAIQETPAWASALGKIERAMEASREVTPA